MAKIKIVELTETEINAVEGLISSGMLEVFHDQGQEALDTICVEMNKALDKIKKAGLGAIEPLIVT